jgi:hypothetical protein
MTTTGMMSRDDEWAMMRRGMDRAMDEVCPCPFYY